MKKTFTSLCKELNKKYEGKNIIEHTITLQIVLESKETVRVSQVWYFNGMAPEAFKREAIRNVWGEHYQHKIEECDLDYEYTVWCK